MQYDYSLTCEAQVLVSFCTTSGKECTDADAVRIEKALSDAGVCATNVACEDGIVYADIFLTFEDTVPIDCDRKFCEDAEQDTCVWYENEVRAGGTDAFLDALWSPCPNGYKVEVDYIDTVKVY